MRRRPLRLAAVLLLTLEIAVALASGCATTPASTSGTDPEACPNVFCNTEDGRKQCAAAGCNCVQGTYCAREGMAAPKLLCPRVTCQSSDGHNQCIAAGCACNPATNSCVPVPKG